MKKPEINIFLVSKSNVSVTCLSSLLAQVNTTYYFVGTPEFSVTFSNNRFERLAIGITFIVAPRYGIRNSSRYCLIQTVCLMYGARRPRPTSTVSCQSQVSWAKKFWEKVRHSISVRFAEFIFLPRILRSILTSKGVVFIKVQLFVDEKV